jgi:uncharacterized membrane protein
MLTRQNRIAFVIYDRQRVRSCYRATVRAAHPRVYSLAETWNRPNEAAIRGVRRYLHIELMLFVLLPIFAAAMARGYGEG